MIEKKYSSRNDVNYVEWEWALQTKGTTSVRPKWACAEYVEKPGFELKLCESRVWRGRDTDLERYPKYVQEAKKLDVASMDYAICIIIIFMSKFIPGNDHKIYVAMVTNISG